MHAKLGALSVCICMHEGPVTCFQIVSTCLCTSLTWFDFVEIYVFFKVDKAAYSSWVDASCVTRLKNSSADGLGGCAV